MLMGLVTKNAILLIDYTNTLRSRGEGTSRGDTGGRSDQAEADSDDNPGDDRRYDADGAGPQ